MSIKVILAKAHQAQLEDEDIKKEVFSVESELNRANLTFQKDTINFVFIKGMYVNSEKKMITACLFVNKTNNPILELHGVLHLRFKNQTAQIAKTTINFDKDFMGTLNSNEALLVHLGIPVKGLLNDENFVFSDVLGDFDDVRITVSKLEE